MKFFVGLISASVAFAGILEDLDALEKDVRHTTESFLGTEAEAAPGYNSLPIVATKGNVPIRKSGNAYLYRSHMEVDVDGAPNAYHPKDIGIDANANGGYPGKSYGMARDSNGRLCIQKATDLYPGFFVSGTSATKGVGSCNPANYADPRYNPYFVLPGGFPGTPTTYDVGAIIDMATGNAIYSWAADRGPGDKAGEASLIAIPHFGTNPFKNGKVRCGIGRMDFVYVVFGNSNRRFLSTYAEIKAAALPALDAWGGKAKLEALLGRTITFADSIKNYSSVNIHAPECGLHI